ERGRAEVAGVLGGGHPGEGAEAAGRVVGEGGVELDPVVAALLAHVERGEDGVRVGDRDAADGSAAAASGSLDQRGHPAEALRSASVIGRSLVEAPLVPLDVGGVTLHEREPGAPEEGPVAEHPECHGGAWYTPVTMLDGV